MESYASYQVAEFRSKLQRALERVRVVLDVTKAPCFADDVHHNYEDKYLLAQFATNCAIASQVNCLASLGLGGEVLTRLTEWSKTSAVSLQFRADETCTFDREEKRDVESPSKSVLTQASAGGTVQSTLTSKVVTTVTEWFWNFDASYELIAIRGVGDQPGDRCSVMKHAGRARLKTTVNTPPHSSLQPAVSFEVNITWLLQQLAGTATPCFQVDRQHAKCHTPSRNPDIEAATSHFQSFASWASQVTHYVHKLLRVQEFDSNKKFDMAGLLSGNDVFIPVLPLLNDRERQSAVEDGTATATAGGSIASLLAKLPRTDETHTLQLLPTDMNQLLGEEARSLLEKRTTLEKTFPVGSVPSWPPDHAVALGMTLDHSDSVCRQWQETVDYIESMLSKQLIAAIGKEVTPAALAEYMRFHYRKLFLERFIPSPFCFSVRRSAKHSPEGTLSIEETVSDMDTGISVPAPIVTLAAQNTERYSMHFALNASTQVSFSGDKYLHAWLSHQFSGDSGVSLSLVSRARQFSSFVVLVGRVASSRAFEPQYGAIIQNKDELTIPLDIATIPTPKEFKDAIASLSPKQQAFAKSFRSMQLASTLFGILVIQIKPQLEKVLNLPSDILTKEIKLTQDLMQLFIDYQIPSDLLSFDSSSNDNGMSIVNPSAADKVDAVKEHVKAMYSMINQAKEEEVADRRREEEYAHPGRFRQKPQASSDSASESNDCEEECMSLASPMCAAPMMCDSFAPMMAPPMCAAAPVMRCAAAPMMMASMPVPAPPMAAAAPPMAPVMQCAPAPPTVASSAPSGPASHPPAPEAAASGSGCSSGTVDVRDYTKVPKEMDRRFEQLDADGALRPSIITPADVWTKRSQKALCAKSMTDSTLFSDEIKREKEKAFDLLDALTKSGALELEHASLHIVVAATHCFDKSVTETVIQDNVNPIEKVERSALIMASTVHEQPVHAMIQQAQRERVAGTSPMLFLEDSG